jgi:tetraacyldisaccharide 4'-kinase
LLPLYAASLIYSLAMRLRAWLYARGIFRSHESSMPVISVGNLTVGGTGKTPITLFLVDRLKRLGRRSAIISRGYKGTHEGRTILVSDGKQVFLSAKEAGDEPFMMANRAPDVPVVIGAQRHLAVELATQETDADVAVCDDAFQHLAIYRNLNILCVNGERGFGNRHVFPYGPLREPFSALARADAVFLNDGEGCREDIIPTLRRHGFGGPVIVWRYAIRCFRDVESGMEIPVSELAGRNVHALAATAAPGGFFHLLEKSGIRIASWTVRPDHHAWSAKDLAKPDFLADNASIMYHVATEKDSVKMGGLVPPDGHPVLAAIVDPQFSGDDETLIERILTESL